jgi:hypothetical protein
MHRLRRLHRRLRPGDGPRGQPARLIRYATENGVAERLTRPQMLRRVLAAACAGLRRRAAGGRRWASSPAWRCAAPFHVDVIKDRGSLGRQLDDGRVENTYRVHVLNTDARGAPLRLHRPGLAGAAGAGAGPIGRSTAPNAVRSR